MLSLAWLVAMAALLSPASVKTGHSEFDRLISVHAQANDVPESLVHRVIMKESRYRAGLVGHGGTIALMQIKLATARSLGYTGDALGLRDPDTNLAYGVKYLAGADRVGGQSCPRHALLCGLLLRSRQAIASTIKPTRALNSRRVHAA
jgi:soluble lytic murein transglycosylase-like protein